MNPNEQPLFTKTPPPIDLARTDVGGRGCDFLDGEVKMNDGNLKEGYLKLFRSIQDNPLWTQPRVFSDAEAWIDILLAVRWKAEPEQKVIGRKILICNRGESLKSLETWMRRWHWNSKKRVTSFLKMLQEMGQIRLTNETVTTRLSVVHYEEYQDYGNANVNTQGAGGKREGHTEEEGKNEKNVRTKEEAIPGAKSRFVPPSLSELQAYISKKGYSFDPMAFIAYYESNGWRVGRNPMKDWQATCVSWQRRQDNPQQAKFQSDNDSLNPFQRE